MGDKEIKEEFNVEALRRAYGDFIDRLRSLLAGNQMVRGRPVLPREADIPVNYPRFEIVLRTNDPNEITLLFRRRDLYLEAFRRGNSNTWLEFSTPNQRNHVVQGSELLGFDGSYVGSHGLVATCGSGRDSIPLGRDALRDAVNSLATKDNRGERAKSLLVVIQMICESIRFEEIEYFILANWYCGSRPSSRILILETNWGRISNGLLRSDAHPDLSTFPIRYIDGGVEHIITFELALALMALLAFNIKGIPKPHYGGGRSNRSADEDDGRALLEVFEVIINNIDGEAPGDLYGTITVSDGLISQYIYNRERGNTESINPKQKATLTGPKAASISALDDFIIEVALMDRDSTPDPTPDDEVSKGQIAWSVYHDSTNVYDKPLSEKIDGSKGSATIIYAVLSNAVQANVEVTLMRGDGEDPADVYGNIFAGNSNLEFEKHESVLFHRDRGNIIQLRKDDVIPLSRSIVAVPLNSELIIRAELWDRDRFPFNPDDEIAKGTKSFPAQLSGEMHDFIDGQYGKIKVKVTWTP